MGVALSWCVIRPRSAGIPVGGFCRRKDVLRLHPVVGVEQHAPERKTFGRSHGPSVIMTPLQRRVVPDEEPVGALGRDIGHDC